MGARKDELDAFNVYMGIEMLAHRKHESLEVIHYHENFLGLSLINLYLNHLPILLDVILRATLNQINISKVILLENGIVIVFPKIIKEDLESNPCLYHHCYRKCWQQFYSCRQVLSAMVDVANLSEYSYSRQPLVFHVHGSDYSFIIVLENFTLLFMKLL